MGILLQLQQLAEPAELVFQLVPPAVVLIEPVRRDAVLRGAMHLVGPDLDFEELAPGAEDGRVERLVPVGLW